MKYLIAAALLAVSLTAIAVDLADTLGSNSTVNDFALQCQHPGMKSEPSQRIKMCINYIDSAKQQVGELKRTPECWKSLDDKASPMAVSDVMFYLAAQPDERLVMAKKALSEIIIIAAPECK